MNLRWTGGTWDTWDGQSWARIFFPLEEVLGITNNELIMSFIFQQFLYLNQLKLGKFWTVPLPPRPDHSLLINSFIHALCLEFLSCLLSSVMGGILFLGTHALHRNECALSSGIVMGPGASQTHTGSQPPGLQSMSLGSQTPLSITPSLE